MRAPAASELDCQPGNLLAAQRQECAGRRDEDDVRRVADEGDRRRVV